MLQTTFKGIAGPVQLDRNRDLMGSSFEIINVVGASFCSIGYWSNRTGLSVTPPESIAAISANQSYIKPKLPGIIWPSESKTAPRGWVTGKTLMIGVPGKTGFKEFETVNGSTPVTWFCIDVFNTAMKLLPYTLQYTFKPDGGKKLRRNFTKIVFLKFLLLKSQLKNTVFVRVKWRATLSSRSVTNLGIVTFQACSSVHS